MKIAGYLAQNRFQFLLGRLKTLNHLGEYTHPDEFQFLLGRLKTKKSSLCLVQKRKVSIPLRQAKNNERWLDARRAYNGFNSS